MFVNVENNKNLTLFLNKKNHFLNYYYTKPIKTTSDEKDNIETFLGPVFQSTTRIPILYGYSMVDYNNYYRELRLYRKLCNDSIPEPIDHQSQWIHDYKCKVVEYQQKLCDNLLRNDSI